ncbi:MAG: ABC transporter permease [Verrucomicrobiota bacterium]
MKFSWFIALRYLKPKGTFVSVITLISVAGVALGVGVLLVVIAVMSGFEKKIKEELLKSEPALIVQNPDRDFPDAPAEEGIPAWRSIATSVRQHPEVKSVSPVVTVTAVLEKKPTEEEEKELEASGTGTDEAQCLLIGVDPQDTVQMERLQKLMTDQGSGSFELAGDNIVISRALANKLGRTLGLTLGESAVNVFGPSFLREYRTYYQEQQRAKKSDDPSKKEAVENKDRDLPLPEEFVVQGVLEDEKMGDQLTGFISLKNAQKLAGKGKSIDGLTVELADAYRAGEVKFALMEKDTLQGWMPQTWMERNQRFFDAIANERGMMYLVLGFISVVAAFCIMNTMITMAVQKRKEIGMMRALGAKTSQIVGLFVVKGLIVAGFGVGSGYLLGSMVLHYRNDLRRWISSTFNWQIFDERIYGLREIPADPRLVDNLMICGIAFVLCTLAAVPPAWLVGRMDPARALRSDR